MVYGRNVGGKELNFEASGALLEASLVMRDVETDSWWSIMTSDAIGGDLEGTGLQELPGSSKSTWGDWKKLHPDTTVLSVDGVEHVENNPYDNYFKSEKTFRNLQVGDKRLASKAPIYSFHLSGADGKDEAFAVPHASISGGALFGHELFGDRVLLMAREPGISFFASSDAYWVPADLVPEKKRARKKAVAGLLEKAKAGDLEEVSGFDTFWYNWVAVNAESHILR